MDALPGIIILLIVAKVAGELFEYTGYPALIGEILAGIIAGPSVFNLIQMTPVIQFISLIGVILLLFITGIEINQKLFRSATERIIVTGLSATIIPLAFGIVLGYLLFLTPQETLFMGIMFCLTSIGISVRTLFEVRQLNSDFGMTIVGGAVVCAIAGIILFGVLSALHVDGNITPYSIIFPVVVAILFIAFISTAGKTVFQFIMSRVNALNNHALSYAAAFVIACGAAYISQLLGLTYVVGAFFAGIALNDSIHKDHDLHESLHSSAFGIFITLFFASVGLLITMPLAEVITPIALPIIGIAVLGKIIGGFIGSFPYLKDRASSLLVGIGMIPRGDLILALAQSALLMGIVSQQLYATTITLVVVTVLITPLLMKIALDRFQTDVSRQDRADQ
ncbi:MAG: cation:proton antiporter [Methanoregula sp.]|nr:cation:proton antiporter [Methanoregula sp.]